MPNASFTTRMSEKMMAPSKGNRRIGCNDRKWLHSFSLSLECDEILFLVWLYLWHYVSGEERRNDWTERKWCLKPTQQWKGWNMFSSKWIGSAWNQQCNHIENCAIKNACSIKNELSQFENVFSFKTWMWYYSATEKRSHHRWGSFIIIIITLRVIIYMWHTVICWSSWPTITIIYAFCFSEKSPKFGTSESK